MLSWLLCYLDPGETKEVKVAQAGHHVPETNYDEEETLKPGLGIYSFKKREKYCKRAIKLLFGSYSKEQQSDFLLVLILLFLEQFTYWRFTSSFFTGGKGPISHRNWSCFKWHVLTVFKNWANISTVGARSMVCAKSMANFFHRHFWPL